MGVLFLNSFTPVAESTEAASVFMTVMQYATVGFGCVTTAISIALCLYFIRSRVSIGKAVGLMLGGEAITGIIVISFAITAKGILDIITQEAAMAMRLVMFSVAFLTSVHLAVQIRRLEVSGGSGPVCNEPRKKDE